jgi:hypothetical protein
MSKAIEIVFEGVVVVSPNAGETFGVSEAEDWVNAALLYGDKHADRWSSGLTKITSIVEVDEEEGDEDG